jgi:phosphohistidine phosphatase
MKLYLMRHGIAVPFGSPEFANDADRPLTDDGRKKLASICRGLSHLDPDWKMILTSPLLRTKQTADIVGEIFEIGHLIQELPALAPGHTTRQLVGALKGLDEVDSVLLVGHEPSLSQHLSCFLFGTPKECFEFKKAGVACIEFHDRPEEGEGMLRWMLSPGQLQRVGKKK